jgi:hypothetical protein
VTIILLSRRLVDPLAPDPMLAMVTLGVLALIDPALEHG